MAEPAGTPLTVKVARTLNLKVAVCFEQVLKSHAVLAAKLENVDGCPVLSFDEPPDMKAAASLFWGQDGAVSSDTQTLPMPAVVKTKRGGGPFGSSAPQLMSALRQAAPLWGVSGQTLPSVPTRRTRQAAGRLQA